LASGKELHHWKLVLKWLELKWALTLLISFNIAFCQYFIFCLDSPNNLSVAAGNSEFRLDLWAQIDAKWGNDRAMAAEEHDC
jgi:hypothetical protein